MQSPRGRILAGAQLNRTANELFGAYISHMDLEETSLLPRMHGHFTVAQVAALQESIIRSLSPDRLFAILRWMLPSLNVTGLSRVLGSVRPSMPPPGYQRVAALWEARLNPDIWSEVRSRTGA